MKVLLADGDSEFLLEAQRFLTCCGHEVQTAADGLACIETIREFFPHVVVLDTGLLWGGSDGVIESLRGDSRTALTSVILMNGEQTTDAEEDAECPTMLGWLSKPCVLSQLLAQIELGRRPLRLATK